MNQFIKNDKEYRKWIGEIQSRYKQKQIKAAVSINQEMIGFYWSIGRDIVEKSAESKWGNGFFDNLSKDMQTALPGVQGLSSSNLRYMKKFYEVYGTSSILPQLVGNLSGMELFSIPWGHHRGIIDLAQEITKDPYNFDFVAMKENYNEKELKDALMDNITKFLLELGKGFAFVGREYKIPIEGTEEKIDILFYHLHLHCYIVVEVKIIPFTSRDIGQVSTYVTIVDDLVKTELDAKTIGLIICKSKNNVLAKYAVNSSKEPIGISEYEVSNLLYTVLKHALQFHIPNTKGNLIGE